MHLCFHSECLMLKIKQLRWLSEWRLKGQVFLPDLLMKTLLILHKRGIDDKAQYFIESAFWGNF